MAEKKKAATSKKTSTTSPKAPKKGEGINVPVFDMKGEAQEAVTLPTTAQTETSKETITQTLRVYQANTHQGTAFTKTRGQVAGSTRKLYRQKGTGRARHGSKKAPIFVGGGVTFGPQSRQVKRQLPKKMRVRALRSLVWEKANNGHMKVIAGFDKATGTTKDMVALLQKLDVGVDSLLLVIEPKMHTARRGARNIQKVTVVSSHTLSPLDVVHHNTLIVAKEVIDKMIKTDLHV